MDVYLGIDVGSVTTKLAIVDKDGNAISSKASFSGETNKTEEVELYRPYVLQALNKLKNSFSENFPKLKAKKDAEQPHSEFVDKLFDTYK